MFYYQLFNIQLFIQHVIYMTKVLITGGAGFIGSNFVKYMLEKYPDYEIVNLDALTYCGNRILKTILTIPLSKGTFKMRN